MTLNRREWIIRHIATPIIYKIINDGYNDPHKTPNRKLKGLNIFSLGNFKNASRHNKDINFIGADAILILMEDEGLLESVDPKDFGIRYKSKYYRCSAKIMEILDGFLYEPNRTRYIRGKR